MVISPSFISIFPLGAFRLLMLISPSFVSSEIGLVVAIFLTSMSPSLVDKVRFFNSCLGTVIVIAGSPLT